MSDVKRAADICDELAEVFRDAATSGRVAVTLVTAIIRRCCSRIDGHS